MSMKRPAAPPTTSGLGAQLRVIVGVVLVWGALFIVLAAGQGCSAPAATPATSLTWDDAIGPLLRKECVVCHGNSAGLSLETYEAALKGGQSGPAVIPGKGAESILVRVLRGTQPGVARMPLNRTPWPEAEIQRISAWIDAGAPRSVGAAPPPAPTNTAIPPAPTNTAIPPAPTNTSAPPTPTNTSAPPTAPTNTPAPAAAGDPAQGEAFWATSPCRNCHGDKAQGGSAPRLAGLGLTQEQMQGIVRVGKGRMPAFSAGRVSDQTLADLYAWLRALR